MGADDFPQFGMLNARFLGKRFLRFYGLKKLTLRPDHSMWAGHNHITGGTAPNLGFRSLIDPELAVALPRSNFILVHPTVRKILSD
jgi:hypothetical protein